MLALPLPNEVWKSKEFLRIYNLEKSLDFLESMFVKGSCDVRDGLRQRLPGRERERYLYRAVSMNE